MYFIILWFWAIAFPSEHNSIDIIIYIKFDYNTLLLGHLLAYFISIYILFSHINILIQYFVLSSSNDVKFLASINMYWHCLSIIYARIISQLLKYHNSLSLAEVLLLYQFRVNSRCWI